MWGVKSGSGGCCGAGGALGWDRTGRPPAHGAPGAPAGSSGWICLEQMGGQAWLSWGRQGDIWRDIGPASPTPSGWAPTTRSLGQQKSHPMETGWGIPSRVREQPGGLERGWRLCRVERL